MRVSRVGRVVVAALCGCAVSPSLAQAAFGPPAGPTSPPFWQCPAVGKSTSCSFLVDLTGSASNPTITVLADPSQEFYDAGDDDEIVAVQNDTNGPVASVHLGVANSGDNLFGFDGDGLCNPEIGATPTGCPFGGTSSTDDPFDYYGPDMSFTLDPGSADDGTVNFNPVLQPGQYTFFGLDAPFGQVVIPAGNVNDYLTTLLTDASHTSGSTSITEAAPTDVTDQATLVGANAGAANGTISYKVYKDPQCTQPAASASSGTVSGGTIPPSQPVGSALATNAVYYWQVSFASSDGQNTSTVSSCGDETMTFGTPPARPSTAVQTALSDGTHSSAQLVVAANTPVTDSATITGTSASSATGTITYSIYSDAACSTQVSAFPLHGDIRTVTAGSAPASAAVTLPVGTYYFRAIYSGDSTHASAASACGAEVLSVRNITSTTTALSAAGQAPAAAVSVQPGTAVTDTASVLIAGAPATGATGTMSYALYSAATDPGCTKPPTASFTGTVLSGVAAGYALPVALSSGRWNIVASYSGDSNDLPSASACGSEVLTILPATVSARTKVSKGTIVNTLTINTAGKITIIAVVLDPRALISRAGHHCKALTAKIGGKCVSVLFGRSSVGASKAGTYTLKLHPGRSARRALRRHHRLKVRETITLAPNDGSKTATSTVVVTVRH